MKRLTDITSDWSEVFPRLIHWRWRRTALSVIVIVVFTVLGFACYLSPLNLATTALLYVVLVVLTSQLVGFAPSAVAAFIGTLSLAYIAPPHGSIAVDDPLDIVAVAMFPVISLGVAHMISRLQFVAREARSNVNRRLLDAEQRERARIARELHDDINQRLALLTSKLQRVEQSISGSAAELRLEVGETSQQMAGLANDIQALSHRLHSSKLEYLGLAAASAGFCRELSRRHGVRIDFQSGNIPRDLGEEISFCLFRVLQEALQNAIKHSHSQQFQVWLTMAQDQIELIVNDAGVGFDPEEALKGPGLGLTSMKERLKLVNGNLFVRSRPTQGTTIYSRVMLSPEILPAQKHKLISAVRRGAGRSVA